MKSLMLLWQVAANELGGWCHVSTTRDIKTASRRVEREGSSFLTITLPSFCKDLEKGLSSGKIDHDQFAGFQFTGGLPRFLGGFLDLVFDRESGCLLDAPSIDAIFAIRELTLMNGRIDSPCNPARRRLAFTQYVECEKEVKAYDATRTDREMRSYREMSMLLFGKVLKKTSRKVGRSDIIPKHGPGTTADGLRGNSKFYQTEWTQRLETVYPMVDYLIPNHGYYRDCRRFNLLEPFAERPIKVTSVNKTMKKPRIIGEEPTCMMYAQQALSEALVYEIRHDDIMGSIIGFKHLDGQLPNRLLAQVGSQHGNFATLDLSDASDRVSNQLVLAMTDGWPFVMEGLQAARSRKAAVEGHGVIRLAKYASMGSALTFPIEAMVFTTVVFLGIQEGLRRRLSAKDVKSLCGKVRIYGDDIIIPVEYVKFVIKALETFGFRVNFGKSHWNGKFRESCGGDYYDGHDVSVVRVKRSLPSSRKDVPEVIATVSLRNRFYSAGMWQTARYLDGLLVRFIPFPNVLSSSPVLGRWSFLGFETQKDHRDHQSPLVKGFLVSTRSPVSILDDRGALLKFFLKRGDLPSADREHLERSGRPRVVDIKLGWGSSV